MEAPVSSDPVVECERKKRKRKKRKNQKHKPRKRNPNRLRRGGRRGGVVRRQKRELRLLKELSSIQAGTMASSSASHPDSSPVIDLTLSDEDIIELPPRSASIEVLDTNDCAMVWFLEEILVVVLDAY
ncbi:uncharacterized protein LOC122571325 [Bombus pyrosoma]|uniref:uncharacterized protein LOC122571325 n=1 Tax=Bombus pyrosoma TaxID=396416 RepID=UPI001CB8D76C|nr:uncharacterized protein LOC122571325 [Bombus pyrosoma]